MKPPAAALRHVLGPDGQRSQHGAEHGQAHLHGVDGVEDRLLVLLHILVVGQRQALHDGEQGHQIAVDPTGLAAHQLGHVGVLLLGHDGGAGGIGVVQINELELPAAPQDDLLGEAATGASCTDGAGAQKLNGVVPVRHGVQAVLGGLGEAQQLGGLLTGRRDRWRWPARRRPAGTRPAAPGSPPSRVTSRRNMLA